MVALSAAIAAVGWVGFFGQRALANNDQWVGGGDGASFNSAGNWNINALPGIPASNDSLEFLGVSTTQNLNDNLMTPTTYNVSGITFDASTASGGSYTIASSGSNGFTLTGNITDNDPTNVQTINDLIALSGTRTTTVTSGGILSLGGLISGSGSWVAAGAGTVNFAGANSYTGTTNASAGIINASNLSSFGNYNSATGGLIVANSAVVNFMATSNIASLSGTSGAATVNVSSGITLTTGYGNTSTGYAGAIIGSGNFAQFGSGTQTLSGTSSYTGTTSIQNSGGLLNLTGTIGSFATPTGAFNVNVASGGSTVAMNVNGGALYTSALTVYNYGVSTLKVTGGGTIYVTGLLSVAPSSSGKNSLLQITSGTVTAGSITQGRGSYNGGATPGIVGTTTDGIYVNGGALNDLGTLQVGGVNTNSNQGSNFDLASGSVTIDGLTSIGNDASSRLSVLAVNGGTFTSNSSSGVQIGSYADTNGPEVSEYLQQGGTAYIPTVTMGGTGELSTGINEFLLTGGITYIGSGGIASGATTTPTQNILLGFTTAQSTAPTLAAMANWSSSMNIALYNSTSGAAPIIQAANSSGGAETITLTGILSGTGGFNKSGAGTLTISGANTYSGITTLTAGTLNINGEGALGGANYGGLTFNGGTLQYATSLGNGSADITQNSGSTAKSVTINAGGAVIDTNGNNVTYNSVFGNSGAGGLTLNDSVGTGSLTFAGSSAPTYKGPTTITSGTLLLGGSISSMATSKISVGAGATFNVTGNSTGTFNLGTSQILTGAGSILGTVVAASNSVIMPGTSTAGTAGAGVTSIGNLSFSGGAILDLGLSASNASNNYISTGSLTFPSTGSVVLDLYTPNTTTPFAAAGTYDILQYSSVSGTPSFTFGTSIAGFTPSFSTAAGPNSTTFEVLTLTTSGAIQGVWIGTGGNTNWTTAGNWQGNNIPHSAGDSALFGNAATPGTVTLNANETVGAITFNTSSGSYAITGGSTLTLDGGGAGASINDLSGVHSIATAIALNDITTIAVNSGAQLTLSGSISNSSGVKSLLINGLGTTVLSGNNSYGPAAGVVGTTLSGAGTLQLGSNTALGAGDLSVTASSATLLAGASNVTVANNILFASPVALSLNNAGGTFTFNGNFNDSGGAASLNILGSGTTVLNGSNTYGGGTSLSAGTLQINSASSLGLLTGPLTFNGGTLALAPATTISTTRNYIIGSAAATINVPGTSSLTNNGTVTGAYGLTLTGSGTLNLGGTNTYSGLTNVSNGTLMVNQASALGSSTASTAGLFLANSGTADFLVTAGIASLSGTSSTTNVNISSGTTLTVGTNNLSTTYAGIISGTGSLIKSGTGSLTLSGSSTYTGTTTISPNASGGTLVVTGSIGTPAAPTGSITNQIGTTTNVSGGAIYGTNVYVDVSGSASLTSAAEFLLTGGGTVNLTGSLNPDSGGGGDSTGLVALLSGSLTAGSVSIGRTPNIGVYSSPTLNPTAIDGLYVNGAVLNVTNTIAVGTTSGSGSTMRVDSGTVNVGGLTSISDTSGSRFSVLDVNGGTFNAGTGGIVLGASTTTGAQEAELLVAGSGTLNTPVITLGSSTQTSGTDVFFAVGGTTYIGSGGIATAASSATYTVTFGNNTVATQPTIAAGASWSTSLPITLTNSSGGLPVIFQAANASGAAANITLSGAVSGSGAGLTKTGSGYLALTNGSSYTGPTNISAGTLVDQQNQVLSSTAAININGNMIIQNSPSLQSITQAVAGGYNSGAWNGSSSSALIPITSSAAAADTTHLHALGVIQNDNGMGTSTPLYNTFEGYSSLNDSDVLIKYTYYGDTNLDGKVDASDYSRIDAAFLANKTSPGSMTGWFNGDFNYDGVINGSDYTLMDNAFNTQGAFIASEIAGPSAVATDQIAGGNSVPEPASLGLLTIGAAGLLGRRKRRI
jgi:autotransporter-associated beta strand protein